MVLRYAWSEYGSVVAVEKDGRIIELYEDGNSPFMHGEELDLDDPDVMTLEEIEAQCRAEVARLQEIYPEARAVHDPIWGNHGDFTTQEYDNARSAAAVHSGEPWRYS